MRHRSADSPATITTRALVRLVFLYACWLGMMLGHEFGHVLHAWLSGGRVALVTIPLLGFSRTDLADNPHPLFVAAGGALWGSLIPLALYAATAWARLRVAKWLQFFAGFCLTANGTYLAAGALSGAADAGDLLRNGAPRWVLIVAGLISSFAGLYLWHRLGVRQVERPTHDGAVGPR